MKIDAKILKKILETKSKNVLKVSYRGERIKMAE